MPYTPTSWEDSPSTDTPITAAQLNRIEAGVDAAIDHVEDATAAHAASAISVTPSGGLAADDVQEALSEHQTDIDALTDPFQVNVGAPTGGDDTTLIQNAIDAASTLAATYGKAVIQFDAAEYVVSGALQTGSGYRAQLKLPNIATTANRRLIEFRGAGFGVLSATEDQLSVQSGGTVIRSTLTGQAFSSGQPSLIGGPSAFGSGAWTNICVVVRDITLRAPDNPSLAMLDTYWCKQAVIERVRFDTNVALGSITLPTNTSGIAIIMPKEGNNARCELRDVFCTGFYVAYGFIEHLMGHNVIAYKCRIGLCPLVDGYHANYITHAIIEWTKYAIAGLDYTLGAGTAANCVLRISELDLEDAAAGDFTPTGHILDTSNYLRGRINYTRTLAGVGRQTGALTITGGTNVTTSDDSA